MDLARLKNDQRAEHMARQTLAEQLHLLDPAWGGVYQYSTDGDWNSPHFEKIMQMQAENLRIYSLAYAQWRDPQYLHVAQEIHRYLGTFLRSPNGPFYTSQDADLVDGKHSADYFALSDAQREIIGAVLTVDEVGILAGVERTVGRSEKCPKVAVDFLRDVKVLWIAPLRVC